MIKLRYFALLSMLLLLITACGQSQALRENATAEPVASNDQTAVVPTSTVSVVSDPEPTQAAVDYCTSCHTNKEQLIDTAKPEEEVISESSGEG